MVAEGNSAGGRGRNRGDETMTMDQRSGGRMTGRLSSSRRRGLRLAAALLLWAGLRPFCFPEVVEHLPAARAGEPPCVALTLDGCESRTPAWFDERVLGFLVREKVPATLFLGGKFAERNAERIRALAALPFIEIENHSYSHFQHMERLDRSHFVREIKQAEEILLGLTGRAPHYFRFPAGNYDRQALQAVEGLGYRVVHWTFASGDPDRRLKAVGLEKWVLSQTANGSILIFHVNGRGWATGEALPEIVRELRAKGYRFVRLDEVLDPPGAARPPAASPAGEAKAGGPPAKVPAEAVPAAGRAVPANRPADRREGELFAVFPRFRSLFLVGGGLAVLLAGLVIVPRVISCGRRRGGRRPGRGRHDRHRGR